MKGRIELEGIILSLKGFVVNENYPKLIANLVAIDDYIEYLKTIGFEKKYIAEDTLRLALEAVLEVKVKVTAGDIIYLIVHGEIKDNSIDHIENELVKKYWKETYKEISFSFYHHFFELFFYLIYTSTEKVEKNDFGTEQLMEKFALFLLKEKKYNQYQEILETNLPKEVMEYIKKYRLRALFK